LLLEWELGTLETIEENREQKEKELRTKKKRKGIESKNHIIFCYAKKTSVLKHIRSILSYGQFLVMGTPWFQGVQIRGDPL